MASFEELAGRQKETGKRIEEIIRNFKKDPASRKTESYLKTRLKKLDEEWSTFETTDNEIRLLENVPLDHEYFINDYYNSTTNAVQKYKEIFEQLMLKATEPPMGKNSTDQNQQGEQHQPQQTIEGGKQSLSPEMVKLTRRQGAIIASLERLLKDEFSQDDVPTARKLWETIESIHFQICEMYDDPINNGYNMDRFIHLESTVREAFKISSPSVHQNTRHQNGHSESIPLPKINIPKFDGNYLKWNEFYDLFSQLVLNQSVSKVHKIWYLKTHLVGEAAKLIQHFSATEENFDGAWAMLVDRYNNRRLLVSKLIHELVDTPGNASSDNFKKLHDRTQECLLAIQNLNINTTSWDPLLLHILLKKLDQATRLRFEQSLLKPREIPTIKEFLDFLERHFQSMETMGLRTQTSSAKTCTSATSETQRDGICKMCQIGSHPLYYCKKFLQSTVPERLKFTQKQKLCVNCLKSGHASKQCTFKNCKKCSKKHNTLLHLESTTNNQATTTTSNSSNTTSLALTDDDQSKRQSVSSSNCRAEGSEVTSLTSTNHQGVRSYIMLGTALVKIKVNNKEIECRAVLDSGSQVNFVTERLIKRLGVPTRASTVHINGIGSSNTKAHRRVNIALHSRINNFSTRLEASVLPHIIADQPSQFIDINNWQIPKNIKLADPKFNSPDQIDILLGAEFTHQLLVIGQIKLSNELPTLQNTLFGWVISGKIDDKQLTQFTCGISTEHEQNLETAISQLWKLEEIETTDRQLSTAENLCEMHFAQHTFNNSEGRFVVRLPFCENTTELGESHGIAFNRFLSLERRLSKNPELRAQYVKFMDEYETMGHMTKIDANSILTPNYFIPHHCVLRPESKTTKLRVVFDASAKTSSGLSLNDLMFTGPSVQSELFSILLRFRLPRFVFTTDIEKMYRQIQVAEDDRRFQLIIWRSEPSAPLSYYQLNTVTYGTRSAPYLATKCLQQIAKDNTVRYPLASQFLEENFYVDDGLGGADSLATTIDIQNQLIDVLKKNGFNLRKWCANHPRLLQNIPEGDQEVDLDFSQDENKSIKALGLTWLPKEDKLRVRVNMEPCKRVTKRTVISDLARIYDPLGILSPVVVTAKIFIQELWELKLDWDEALPASLHTKWLQFRTNLNYLEKLQISRHVFKGGIPDSVQLHIFTDASEKAYGATAYVRATFKDGTIMVRLLCAKSRIAPLKKQTLPRLELCAAELGALLGNRIRKDLNMKDKPVWYWTDSEIVLAWINAPSSSFQTFVSNRIARIQNSTLAEQWRHVSSKMNPADVLSRGVAPERFDSCSLWFYGPPFLHGNETIWPQKFSAELAIQNNLERKKKAFSSLPLTADPYSFVYSINHKNSFPRLQRIMAYVLRFINNAKGKKETGRIPTPIELNEGLKPIIKAMQASEYKDEISQLKKYKEIKGSSSLCNLSPFLDENDILRVGGRLEASDLTYDAKHQMLIPYNDPISKLIFDMYHRQNKHCGSQTLLGMVRQRFWPIKGKLMARATVHKCIMCSRAKPALLQQVMGDLPSTRVTPSRPFINSGVDYAGPIWVHYKVRGKKPHKAYIAVFCCFATKAVHMELVTDLTTEAFLGALRRFISRRGHCQNIYCDNATNFVGARNLLEELQNAVYSAKASDAIMSECSTKGINFKFIPPRAPHFGGLWEAAVRSAKHHLLRSVGNASLTYEELETLMIEIEAVLNSRPISPLSNDPNDVAALTPGHFLVGGPLTAQIDATAQVPKGSLSAKWTLVNKIKTEFWKRWQRDYLNELQGRNKWNKRLPNLEIGSIVIIKDKDSAVMEWPLGRVIKTYTGPDGAVRVADIKTASKIVKRSIDCLAKLPISTSTEEDEQGNSESTSPLEKISEVGNVELQKPEQLQPEEPTTSSEHTPRKRRRIHPSHTMVTLLITLLALPLIFADKVEITQFDPNIGIHFEGLGRTRMSRSEWNLITYYELQPYWREMNALAKGTTTLQHLCNLIDQNAMCINVLRTIEFSFADLRDENILLKEKRIKRGAVDIVGNIANSLFGILDSNYAEQMSSTINAVKGSENQLKQLLRNQTSIIDATLNIFKQDEKRIKEKFDYLDSQFTEIVSRLHENEKEQHQTKLFQIFMSLSVQLSVVAARLHRIQSEIVAALSDSHHGKISPTLISPSQLQAELVQIRNHLPASLQLPVNENNLLQLYKIMRVRGGATEEHVIFHISIPLCDPEILGLLKPHPIPALINGTMLAIRPCGDFIAINTHRDQYFVLSEKQWRSCIIIEEDTFLCPHMQSKFNADADKCLCEISLLNHNTRTNCNIAPHMGSSSIIELEHNNQWMFTAQQRTRLTAVCDQQLSQVILEGSGLLKISPDCTLKHKSMIIQGHQSFSTTLQVSYTAVANMSDVIYPNEVQFGNLHMQSYADQVQNISEIQRELHQQVLTEFPLEIKHIKYHHATVAYAALMLGIVACIILIYKKRRCRKMEVSQPAPSPAPRQGAPQSDFVFSVT